MICSCVTIGLEIMDFYDLPNCVRSKLFTKVKERIDPMGSQPTRKFTMSFQVQQKRLLT